MTSFGIAVVTPENQQAPWLLFESGAIAKAVGEDVRLVPLLFGLETSDLTGPLSDFQARRAERPELARMCLDLAKTYCSPDAEAVSDNLEAHWGRFEDKVSAVPDQKTNTL